MTIGRAKAPRVGTMMTNGIGSEIRWESDPFLPEEKRQWLKIAEFRILLRHQGGWRFSMWDVTETHHATFLTHERFLEGADEERAKELAVATLKDHIRSRLERDTKTLLELGG